MSYSCVMKSICVFCGSNKGFRSDYSRDTEKLGKSMVRHGYRLVYGGGNVGLMGLLAQTVLDAGGSVLGIIPQAIHDKVPALEGVRTIVVQDMHERKAAMHENSDGFIALPGGIGTFEEILEAFTWSQLGFHRKPLAILNTADFYAPLINQFSHCVDEGFLKEKHNETLIISKDAEELLTSMENYTPHIEDKWLNLPEGS